MIVRGLCLGSGTSAGASLFSGVEPRVLPCLSVLPLDSSFSAQELP